MKIKPLCLKLVIEFLFIFTLMIRNGEAFDNNAHKALSERATTGSTLDNFLKTTLGFELPGGILQSVEGKRVTVHIQDGALLEDSLVLWRVRHHFHNPRLSWDQAGLRPPGAPLAIGQSSVVWSQNTNQGLEDGGKRSWHQARDAYFTALTSTSQLERKKWYATTFRLLGHAIHHVQDAAVPSHTRNDSHAPGNSDRFHSFAERPEILALINTITATPLSPSFLSNQASSDSRYPVPISRLLDVNAGDIGALALGNGDGIGIAEYSNANFFSDDSIFPETFPYPGLANVRLSTPELDPTTGEKKSYLIFKPGFGDGTNYRLAQASSLRNITGTNVPTDIGLDYKVFTDYAFKLFPRAIAYSAGLIDYFFRGRIFAFTGDVGCIWPQVPPIYPSVEMVVYNDSPAGEETGNGQVDFTVHYEVGGVKHFFPLVSQSVFLERDQVTRFTFSTAPLNAVPTNAVNVFMIVTYRGPLGQETNAVIGGKGEFFKAC